MQPYAHNMKVFALVGPPLSAPGAQIEQFLVDAHNMKVIENLCPPQGAQIEQSVVDAHNMKVIEKCVRSKGLRLSSFLLTLTT